MSLTELKDAMMPGGQTPQFASKFHAPRSKTILAMLLCLLGAAPWPGWRFEHTPPMPEGFFV